MKKDKMIPFERGIDTIEVGLICNIGIFDLTDIGVESDRKIITPVIVVGKEDDGDIPVYDVAFFNKTRHGEMLGYNTIKGIPLWRYFARTSDDKNVPLEGLPPMWIINSIEEYIKEAQAFVLGYKEGSLNLVEEFIKEYPFYVDDYSMDKIEKWAEEKVEEYSNLEFCGVPVEKLHYIIKDNDKTYRYYRWKDWKNLKV